MSAKIFLILVSLSSVGQGFQFFSTQKKTSLSCEHIFPIQQVFLSQHYSFQELTPELEKRTIQQYLKRIDPSKIYLLEEDKKLFEKTLENIFNKVKDKDCKPLKKVQNDLNQRIKERFEKVKRELPKINKVDETIEISLNRDQIPYPRSKEEAENFLIHYLHLQIANHLITDVKLNEAKEKVLKSWTKTLTKSLEIKDEEIFSNFLDSFARALDPHSAYMAPDFNEDFRIQMSLSLQGIGATLSSQDGFTVIENLVSGGPAAKSGLLEIQDRIIAVGQGESGSMENIMDWDLKDVVRKIRGPKGTKVRLKIMRLTPEGKKTFEILLERDQINLEDEAAQIYLQSRELEDKKIKLGIIKLPSFYNDGKLNGKSAAKDVEKLIEKAKLEKVEGLVLDFSTNGGGSLEDAVKIAGLFIAKGNIVKQTTRSDPMGLKTILSDKNVQVNWPGPLVILISRISASASEIVAGALQDYRRAIVVGSDHTYGKGTVQTVIDIPPYSGELGAVKITIGSFYIPGGYSTQHRGVMSDIVFPTRFDFEEVGEKNLDYSLLPSRLSPFLSPEAYNKKEDKDAWIVVTPEHLKLLETKSKGRVSLNPEFKKVQEDLEKMRKNERKIKIAELFRDPQIKEEKQKSKKRLTDSEKEEEYLKRPDIQESINILVDYIQLTDVRFASSKNK